MLLIAALPPAMIPVRCGRTREIPDSVGGAVPALPVKVELRGFSVSANDWADDGEALVLPGKELVRGKDRDSSRGSYARE